MIKTELFVCGRACQHSQDTAGWRGWHIVTKFETGIDLDEILDKFDNQGHQVKKRDVYDILASVPVYKIMTKIGHHLYLLMCKAISLYFNSKIIGNHKKYCKVSLFGDGYA